MNEEALSSRGVSKHESRKQAIKCSLLKIQNSQAFVGLVAVSMLFVTPRQTARCKQRNKKKKNIRTTGWYRETLTNRLIHKYQ